MALTRIETSEKGASRVYYARRNQKPLTVRALRALVLLALLSSLFGLIMQIGNLIDLREALAQQEQELYQLTSWDLDRSIDGRWRYCRTYPDQCQEPWGNGGGPLHLFRPEGWDGVAFMAIDWERAVSVDAEGNPVHGVTDLHSACLGVPCTNYPLHGDYSGPGQAVFMGKEALKVLGSMLDIVTFFGFAIFFFLIAQYALIFIRLGRGHPKTHLLTLRIGLLQLLLDAGVAWFVADINRSLYSFELSGGLRWIAILTIPMVVLSLIPSVRRYCNTFSFHREPHALPAAPAGSYGAG